MPNYIYELPAWPYFTWDRAGIGELLSKAKIEQARLLGRMESLGFDFQRDAALKTMTAEVIKSSEIEGEILNPDQVRSSVARHLGMKLDNMVNVNKHVDGVVTMMMDATEKYAHPLTAHRLFGWHNVLFPTGMSDMRKIKVAAYRESPMEIVSGAEGDYRVHFEAPEASKLESEMTTFLAWFNDDDRNKGDWMLISGLAHLWFITIHPFDDGNGRIARAISDMCLARDEKSPQRFYSLSSQIRKESKEYYHVLESTQKGGIDITPWMEWFVRCTMRAIEGSQHTLADVFAKAAFWNRFGRAEINERQREMLNRLLDGFEGKLTPEKWSKITDSAIRTAKRDIQNLVEKDMLVKNPEGGRSTSYRLAEAAQKSAETGLGITAEDIADVERHRDSRLIKGQE